MNVAAPILLLLYAAIAGTCGHHVVGRWTSLDRSPVASIIVWQTLSGSALVSVVLAGGAVAVPSIPVTTDVAYLLSACADALREHYATPGGATTSIFGAFVGVAVLGRGLWGIGRQLWIARRHSSRQRCAVRLVGRPGQASGSVVLESVEPVVYCVPGRQRTVVLTSAALSRLDAAQLAAVMSHEDVHLRCRHHVVLSVARGLERAFPFVALYRVANLELTRLVEVHADDAAAKRHDRRVLAMALVHLAEARSPVGSLGAGGGSTLRRVSRLAEPPRPLGRMRSVLMAAAVGAMVTAPPVMVALPALGALAVHYCPVPWAI